MVSVSTLQPYHPHVEEQPDCDHTTQELLELWDLPAVTGSQCISCMCEWFAIEENGEIAVQRILPCGHIISANCFLAMQEVSIGCYSSCAQDPANGEKCHACQVHGARPRNDINELLCQFSAPVKCIEIRPFDMIYAIGIRLEELAHQDNIFKIDTWTHTALVQYLMRILSDLRGRLNTPEDLALLLDPTRSLAVDPFDEVSKVFVPLLASFPALYTMGYLPPLTSDEGWITTFLRTVTSEWNATGVTINSAFDHFAPHKGIPDLAPECEAEVEVDFMDVDVTMKDVDEESSSDTDEPENADGSDYEDLGSVDSGSEMSEDLSISEASDNGDYWHY